MRPTIRQVQEAVAIRRHTSVRAIKSQTRLREVVRARHDAMYLARRLTGHSYNIIGQHFGGRDHSTVCNGYFQVQLRIHRNEKTRRAIAGLIDGLTQ